MAVAEFKLPPTLCPPPLIRAVYLSRGGIRGSESIGRRFTEPTRNLTRRRNANAPPKGSEGKRARRTEPREGQGFSGNAGKEHLAGIGGAPPPSRYPGNRRGARGPTLRDYRRKGAPGRISRPSAWEFSDVDTPGGRRRDISKRRILSAGAPSRKPLDPRREPFPQMNKKTSARRDAASELKSKDILRPRHNALDRNN